MDKNEKIYMTDLQKKYSQADERIRRVGSDKTGHWELINEGQGRL